MNTKFTTQKPMQILKKASLVLVLIALISLVQNAFGQVVYQNNGLCANTNNTTTSSLSITNFSVSAGSNRLLVVFSKSSQSQTITSITFNGSNLVRFGTPVSHSSNAAAKAEIWYMILGSSSTGTTANTITATYSGTNQYAGITAAGFSNVNQTLPLNGLASNSFNTGATSSSLTTSGTVGDMAVEVISSVGTVGTSSTPPSFTPTSNQTPITSCASTPNFAFGQFAAYKAQTGSSQTLSYTISNTSGTPSTGIQIAVNIRKFCDRSTAPLATASGSQTQDAADNTYYASGDCSQLITYVVPGTSNGISGNTTAKVWVETSEPTTSNSIYTRRHTEVAPAANAATATGRVTIYALQAEFDSYNNISTAALPTGPSDATGISRLRIYKYSGTSSNGTGLPGTYTGTPVTIDPADAAIVWNSTNNYWEISLDITGFSGFFIGADNAVILPVKLTGFAASKQAGTSLLNWKAAQEDNIATYTIERSSDGRSFSTVGSVVSLGNTTAARTYSFPDASPIKGANYYRLKITEKDGKVSYSEMRLLNFGSQISIALFPNPAKDKAVITGVEAGMRIRLLDAVGKVVLVKVANSTTETLAFSSLSGGLYSVQVYNNSGQLLSTARLVKE